MPKFSVLDTLNKQSRADRPKPEESTSFTIDIALDDIIPAKESKNFYGIRDIEELAADIEQFGLGHNLIVKEADENGKYELIGGERRWRALNLLAKKAPDRYKTAPCKVESYADPLVQELRLIQSNAMARVLKDWEKVEQANRTKQILTDLKKQGYKFKGRMRDIVADMLEVSPAQMGRMESIGNNLSPELKADFANDKINITQAYDLSRQSADIQAQAHANIAEYGKLPKTPVEDKATATENEHTKEAAKQTMSTHAVKEDTGMTVRLYGHGIDVDFDNEDNINPEDFVAIAQIVAMECLDMLGRDKSMKKALKTGLQSLIDKMED